MKNGLILLITTFCWSHLCELWMMMTKEIKENHLILLLVMMMVVAVLRKMMMKRER